MKSNKIKVSFVESDNLEELKELTNKEIEAIQVNIRNVIKDVNLKCKPNGGFIMQINYEELELDENKQILNESEEIK